MSKAEALFKPNASQIKGDATTRAARAIIETDQAANLAKTERLRAARLQNEAKARAAAQLDAAQKATGRAAPKGKRTERRPGPGAGSR